MQTSKKLFFLVSLSIILGIYIPFYFVFVNAAFIQTISIEYLPIAYIVGGLGGFAFARLFNLIEKNFSLKTTLSSFSFFIAIILGIFWYSYSYLDNKNIIVFLAYIFFWISSSIVILIFWKIPTQIFNLYENKKYNGIISLGEVLAAILVYIVIIPMINALKLIEREHFLLIAAASLLIFGFLITSITFPKTQTQVSVKSNYSIEKFTFKKLFKSNLFRFLFFSVILAMITQLLVDFSLMNITNAKKEQLGFNVASFFSVVFGCMRILELIVKLFVSKNIIREQGVFAGFYALIFAIGFIYIIALITHLIADSLGLVVIILAIASIGKVIERSVNRALFIPSQNILFQAFDANSKSIVQSYTSGYGVPLGQLFAGILMLLFLLIDSYEMKITLLFVFLILITIIWFLNTVKLKKGYQKQLLDISNSFYKEKPKQDTAIQRSKLKVEELLKIMPISEFDSILLEFFKTYQKSKSNSLIRKSIIQLEQCIRKTSKENLLKNLNESSRELKIYFFTILVERKIDCSYYLYMPLLLFDKEVEGFFEKLYQSAEPRALEKIIEIARKTAQDLFYKINYYSKFDIEIKKLLYNKLISSNTNRFLKYIKNEDQSNYIEIFENISFSSIKNNSELTNLFNELMQKSINEYCIVQNLGLNLKVDTSLKNLNELLILEANHKLKIIFCHLAIKYPVEVIENVKELVFNGTNEMRMIGIELLELNLEAQDLEIIAPIFKYDDSKGRLRKLESEFPQPTYTLSESLNAIVFYYKNILSCATVNTAFAALKKRNLEVNQGKKQYLLQSNDPLLSFQARAKMKIDDSKIPEHSLLFSEIESYLLWLEKNFEEIVIQLISNRTRVEDFKYRMMNLSDIKFK